MFNSYLLPLLYISFLNTKWSEIKQGVVHFKGFRLENALIWTGNGKVNCLISREFIQLNFIGAIFDVTMAHSNARCFR